MANAENTRNNNSRNDEIDLHQLWDVINFNKYKIIAAGGAGLLLAVVYLMLASPVYKASALIQVSSNQNNSILGGGGAASLLGGGGGNKSDIEINLARSRMVLGKTVDDLGIDLQIQYDELPLIGQLSRDNIAANKALGVKVFNISDQLRNREFILENIDGKSYRLYIPEDIDGKTADSNPIEGKVGSSLKASGIELFVSQIDAKEGQKFLLTKQSRLAAIEAMRNNLTVNDVGRDTGILAFSYVGTDKALIKNILNQVVSNYVVQDQEFGISSAGKSLDFINKQLPVTKESLQIAEDEYNAFREKNATIDLTVEAASILQNLTKIEADLTMLATKEAELAELFTKDHPNYQALLEQRKILMSNKDSLTQRVSTMPQLQQDIIRLRREVEIQQAVYMQLLNKRQEFSILQASSSGKVRVVDEGVTLEEPIKPKKSLILFLLTIGFAGLASVYFVLKSLFNRTITEAQSLNKLGVDVLASIPLSTVQKNKDTLFKSKNNSKATRTDYLLAKEMPTDATVEAIRALRTSVYFMVMEAKNNILMVSGATSGLGKSFVSVNLAVVMAQSSKKVLIVDADMRNGYLHAMLKQPLDFGFSDVLSGKCTVNDAIRKTEIDGLDIITRGELPNNPAELLMSSDLTHVLKEAMSQYDYIILDVPPIMAVTDAAIMGQQVGSTVIVARYGVTTEQDIENTISRFNSSNVVVKGAVLNGVEKSANNQYAYEAYNNYQHRS
ncbi:polysaccharide biosynthesis tyrosine autokinase [Vitreoscilla stercoraria]|uniref:Polysaccharide biosynthesis tyrosine autokinase n=1 Tax=Vitreoscilla stercoraria TaxID=61 RepID=A0ABY4EBK8_VITST|nr:polysaccharide biosynthesis tyrosine autokinase [Vitreoscilla stercoraria]UOO92728.1 polysaccharide biosynthesis tyrosine autokinase [Vitreoscilla stercoraria]